VAGQRLVLDALPTYTIHDIKEKVQQQIYVPPDMQDLIYSGKKLRDDMTIQYYNIRNESTLHLVIRPKASNEASTVPTDINAQGGDYDNAL